MSEELEAKLIDALATVKLREQRIMDLTSTAADHLQRAEVMKKRAEDAEAALERDRTAVAMAVAAMRDAIEAGVAFRPLSRRIRRGPQ